MSITVSYNFQGAIVLSTVKGGYRVECTYYGYSLTDAKKRFRAYAKEQIKLYSNLSLMEKYLLPFKNK